MCQDGRAGVNFEHSAIDGHTALRLVSDVFADNVVSFAQSITKTIYSNNTFPSLINAEVRRAANEDPALIAPKKLTFELPQGVIDKIYFAETALSDQIVASETKVLEFTGFGKLLIVRNKMSPDSFVQLSMQLAHYRLYGKVVSQYEPVLTKGFYHGRTEAMRTATKEAANFCKLWLNPETTDRQKLEALRVATKVHSGGIKLAASGKGLERHLYALMKIGEKNGISVPGFFNSTAYKKLNHTILSTSNCGNPSLRLFGFGPVVQDGYGIGYIIRDNGVQYSISSKHRQTERFAHTLKQTLIDMGKLLSNESSVEVTCSSSSVQKKEQPVTTPEYCAAYTDTFGESTEAPSKQVEELSLEKPKRPSLDRSATFSRVIRRQSSFSVSQLVKFGKTIDPSIMHLDDDDDM